MTVKLLQDPPRDENEPEHLPQDHDGDNDQPQGPASPATTATKLMANFPVVLKKKADTILDLIKSSKGVLDFNEGGELLVDGHLISGSHISDLIYDVLLGKSGFEPKGSEQFLKGLLRLNVPERFIRNKTRRTTLRRMKLSSPQKIGKSKAPSSSKRKNTLSRPRPLRSKRVGLLNWETYT
jgi:hypothetical protein